MTQFNKNSREKKAGKGEIQKRGIAKCKKGDELTHLLHQYRKINT